MSGVEDSSSGQLSDLDRLTIERACERLIYEFCEIIDTRQDAKLHGLFTEDATYARPTAPTTIVSGRDTIVKSFEARPAGRVARHTCSNVRVTVESAERATGYHRVVLYMGADTGAADPQFGYKSDGRTLVGEFDDVFVKTAEGWRFLSRRGRVVLHT
jgi:hypothetical protein